MPVNMKKVNPGAGTRRRSVEYSSQDISHGPVSRGGAPSPKSSTAPAAKTANTKQQGESKSAPPAEVTLVDQIFWFRSDTTEERMPFRVHPASVFMNIWNLCAAFFIITCALFLPFEMSFGYQYSFSGSLDQVRQRTLLQSCFPCLTLSIVVLGSTLAGHGHVLLCRKSGSSSSNSSNSSNSSWLDFCLQT